MKNRSRIIEVLKKESISLRDRLNSITAGTHAQHELKVKNKALNQKVRNSFHASRIHTIGYRNNRTPAGNSSLLE